MSEKIINALTLNSKEAYNDDPFNCRHRSVQNLVRSFDTDMPQHPRLLQMIYQKDPRIMKYHDLGMSIREQDISPVMDTMLAVNIFFGSLNSTTGFTSQENDFSVLCPICLFKGRTKFSCHYTIYPSLSLDPASVRSSLKSLPAENYSIDFSVDMFGVQMEVDPEANLLATPESRYEEYLRRKKQISQSIDQTMQEQICLALASLPTIGQCRMRNESPTLKSLLENVENISDFVYGEIQKEVFDFCAWTFNPVLVSGAIEDAYNSLLCENIAGDKPEFFVTTPEVASLIADVEGVQTEPRQSIFTVDYGQNHFVPSQIKPYEGLSKPVSIKTMGIVAAGRILPILKVPHLMTETKTRYNVFEHNESFWVFNTIGFVSRTNASIGDYKSIDRTKIRVSDFHLGLDGSFSMDDCLKRGGGLLPITYDRFQYHRMARMVPGLLPILAELNEAGLVDLLSSGHLPSNSKYNLMFPSPKVRFVANKEDRPLFRSSGVYGNRPSFDNWHPPCGDIEAAKDWLAKKIFIDPSDVDEIFDYVKKCSLLSFTHHDITVANNLIENNGEDFQARLQDDGDVAHIIKDLISNKGYTKFVSLPFFLENIYNCASLLLQDRDLLSKVSGVDKDDLFLMRTLVVELERVISFREKLFSVSKKFLDLSSRIHLPYGIMTDCPSSLPLPVIPDGIDEYYDVEGRLDRSLKFAYRFLQHTIFPLVFDHVYNIGAVDKACCLPYEFPNPNNNNQQRIERFIQPFFRKGFLSNNKPRHMAEIANKCNLEITEVTPFDPLYSFSLELLTTKKGERRNLLDRQNNFFDHFISHRFNYLREMESEPNMVRMTAAFLNLVSYTPIVERAIGHACLMNRSYRIIRNCQLTVAMAAVCRAGKNNMMYAVGNLSTVTTQTANNGILIDHRINGNCFITDPLSAGRVIPNAVSKGLVSGMTSTMADVHGNLEGEFRLKNKWYRNMAFVQEVPPGRHPLWHSHHFLPINGRHLPENFNSAGFDVTNLDRVAKEPGGWYSENMYSLKEYSEAHLIFGDSFPTHKLYLYERGNSGGNDGLQQMFQKANIEREMMAGRVIEKHTAPSAIFSGRSNLCFLERQLYNGMSPDSVFAEETWMSRSPLKENSCSETRFVETLHLNRRRTDMGIKILDNQGKGLDQKTKPLVTGVKGRYGTER